MNFHNPLSFTFRCKKTNSTSDIAIQDIDIAYSFLKMLDNIEMTPDDIYKVYKYLEKAFPDHSLKDKIFWEDFDMLVSVTRMYDVSILQIEPIQLSRFNSSFNVQNFRHEICVRTLAILTDSYDCEKIVNILNDSIFSFFTKYLDVSIETERSISYLVSNVENNETIVLKNLDETDEIHFKYSTIEEVKTIKRKLYIYKNDSNS
ncbi:gp223 [Sphingomonas phage PAU]|uniref:gp223 n=1 Tax=Sphingomonas phage PAU TaxID=1150991 RepID=UPI000257337D|nr:gp223 [Sphingomonas phage PAU]AFF28221.1 gp223 [Sphingomonas phage PAU]